MFHLLLSYYFPKISVMWLLYIYLICKTQDAGSKLLQNDGTYIPVYTASYLQWLECSYLRWFRISALNFFLRTFYINQSQVKHSVHHQEIPCSNPSQVECTVYQVASTLFKSVTSLCSITGKYPIQDSARTPYWGLSWFISVTSGTCHYNTSN